MDEVSSNNVWDVVYCGMCDELIEVELGSNEVDTLVDHAPDCPGMAENV